MFLLTLEFISIFSILQCILSSKAIRQKESTLKDGIPIDGSGTAVYEKENHSKSMAWDIQLMRDMDALNYARATLIYKAKHLAAEPPVIVFYLDKKSEKVAEKLKNTEDCLIPYRADNGSVVAYAAVLDVQPPFTDTTTGPKSLHWMNKLTPQTLKQKAEKRQQLVNRSEEVELSLENFQSNTISVLTEDYFQLIHYYLVETEAIIYRWESYHIANNPEKTCSHDSDESEAVYSNSTDIIDYLNKDLYFPYKQMQTMKVQLMRLLESAEHFRQTLPTFLSEHRPTDSNSDIVGDAKFDWAKVAAKTRSFFMSFLLRATILSMPRGDGKPHFFDAKNSGPQFRINSDTHAYITKWEVFIEEMDSLRSNVDNYLRSVTIKFGITRLLGSPNESLQPSLVQSIMKTMRELCSKEGKDYAITNRTLEIKMLLATEYLRRTYKSHFNRNKISYLYIRFMDLLQRIEDERTDNCKQVPQTNGLIVPDAKRFQRCVRHPLEVERPQHIIWMDAMFEEAEMVYTDKLNSETPSNLNNDMKCARVTLEFINASFENLKTQFAMTEPRHCQGIEIYTIHTDLVELLNNMEKFVVFNLSQSNNYQDTGMPHNDGDAYTITNESLILCLEKSINRVTQQDSSA